jgi:uncharacterized membrane protein YhaH (DUF805 family)
MVVAFALGLVEGFAGLFPESDRSVLALIYQLAVLLPALAVSVRRLHDTGRSGWWLLISFVPLLGGLVLFIFLVLDSQAGLNQFGPDPKAAQWSPVA